MASIYNINRGVLRMIKTRVLGGHNPNGQNPWRVQVWLETRGFGGDETQLFGGFEYPDTRMFGMPPFSMSDNITRNLSNRPKTGSAGPSDTTHLSELNSHAFCTGFREDSLGMLFTRVSVELILSVCWGFTTDVYSYTGGHWSTLRAYSGGP